MTIVLQYSLFVTLLYRGVSMVRGYLIHLSPFQQRCPSRLGTQIAMVGILDNTRGPSATGEYTIDNKSPTLFSIDNTVNSRGTLFQQTIFTSDPLHGNIHEIVVRWNGQHGQQRFGFTNFYVQRVSSPVWLQEPTATTISPSPISTQSQTSSLTQSSASSSSQASASETAAPVAAIIGGIIGGVVAVATMMMFLWFLRRRRRENVYDPGHHHSAPQRMQTEPLLGYVVEPLRLSTMSASSSSSEYRPSRSVTLSVSGTSTTRASVTLLKEKQSQAVRAGETEADLDAETTDFLMHQDRGVRLGASTREGRRVIEVPPEYTA